MCRGCEVAEGSARLAHIPHVHRAPVRASSNEMTRWVPCDGGEGPGGRPFRGVAK
eukprot:CAMPEP_0185203424 /NCGR_PEP_ID=MMETSP1140-20130426/52990_1 /TAXON_ID=298111 /ORGANISM="Pavlova sp., Strain CCMP459" /LENGTH=54 /DNA_ID=CAMNT_0027770921 /DNA_START=19 /DNA_END=180 /DNA_ORIENTATION=-